MATSGSKTVKVTNYDNLKFSWEFVNYSIPDNTTTIGWKMELISGSSGKITSGVTKNWVVTVNGTKYSGTNNIGIANNTTKTLASGVTTILHDADGSKTFNFTFKQEFGITFAGQSIGTITGNGSGVLETIPRQATVTGADNFNDESNPTMTYSNPAGNAVTGLAVCISLDGTNADIAYRDVSKTASSYTFELTEAERNVLRNATVGSNSRTVKFHIRTIIGGVTYYHSIPKTFTVINANPTVNPTVIDIDSVTTGLTGNNRYAVKYFSDLRYTANATAYKGATIKEYLVTCGGASSNASSGTFTNVESPTVNIKVTDSRGNTTTKIENLSNVNYVKLTCNMTATAPTTDGNMTININGNYFNGAIGATANTLTVQYRYKVNGGSYSGWVAATPTLSGNTYKATVNLTGKDYKNSYTIQARAIDKLMTVNSAEKTVKTTPVFDWGENDFNFNVTVSGADRFISNKSETGFRHIHGSSGNSISFGIGATGVNRGIYDDTQDKWLLLNNGTDVLINGYKIGANNILLLGGYYMNASQQFTFYNGQKVSQQENGIVLIFSAYANGASQNYNISSHFVPKYLIAEHSGAGMNFIMSASKFAYVATKYLYITDTTIKGNDENQATGTNNGITFNNSAFVLRAVIGV